MDEIFNSPVIQKLQAMGQKLGQNKFVGALQAGMMSLMAVIMVGAISQILTNVLGPSMANLLATDSALYQAIAAPYTYTMNMLGLWSVVFIAFSYARNLKVKSPIAATCETVAVFMLTVTVSVTTDAGSAITSTYLTSQGMFTGFVVVFVCVQTISICEKRDIYIHMPDVVPNSLQSGFAALVPLLIDCIIFSGLNTVISVATAGAYTLPSGFMALLSTPLSVLVSVPGMVVITIIVGLLWSFGIHGSAIISSFISPLAAMAITANGDAVAAGGVAVFNAAMLFTFTNSLGGTGQTFPLVLMGLRSKSEQIRAVCKAGLVPGLFQINEPVAFGMPIMYNPILVIPYILCMVVSVILAWLAMDVFHLISPFWIYLWAGLPIGILDYLKTLDIRNVIFDYFLLIPCGLIWYPFYKAYERQLVAKEQAANANEGVAA